MKYYIGADLGTSALKLMLLDENGKIVNSVSAEYEVSYPHPGWSEQNPEDWWNAFCSSLPVLTKGIDTADLAALAVAGQMHGLVVLDENDRVIRPAILWNDGRTGKETEWLNTAVGQDFLVENTGNIAFAGFTVPKLLWMKANEPEQFARIKKIMLPKDYLNYRLTGVFATDLSDASGTLLLDVKNRRWSEKMLDLCGVSLIQMPQVFESYQKIGFVKPEVAEMLGLSAETLVAAGAGDNAAAAIGTGITGENRCNISLGTSGTVFLSMGSFSAVKGNALHSFCHADGGYHLLACILSAASCNKWLCKVILGTEDYRSLEEAIPDDRLAGKDLFFLPYLMGERSPINDTNATGLFIGLRPDTTRTDLFLAVLEGVSFAIRDNLEAAREAGICPTESFICGGGGKSPLWRKILCNVLGIKLNIPVYEEGPGFGAAALAMTAMGEYPSVEECAATFAATKATVLPDAALTARYEAKYRKFQKIYPAVKTLYQDLKGE